MSICQYMNLQWFMPKDIIVTLGDPPEQFYIVLKGKVSKYWENGQHESDYLPGECFNEKSVIYQINASGNYISKERTYVLIIKKNDYDQIIWQA